MAKTKNRESERQRSSQSSAPGPAAPPPAPPVARQSLLAALIQWFLSQTVRHATAMRKHVHKLLNHQRDILSPQAISAIEEALLRLQHAVAGHIDKAGLEQQMEELEKVANKWLKPYPNPGWRENIEVLLLALTVAMGIRTFFLQPFKIPTGSMQPTLFGVTSVPDYSRGIEPPAEPGIGNFQIPTGWERIRAWFAGVSYVQVRAKVDGPLERVDPPFKIFIFNIYQTLQIGGVTHWIWFPPDCGEVPLDARAGYRWQSKTFHKGDEVFHMKVVNGDHLFVDRVTYNFRRPERGEIIVFATQGIEGLRQDQFYIKRMVAMGGEKVQVGDDRHLVINGRRLDASTPHFEKVYNFNPKEPPRENRYSGHVNDKVAKESGFFGSLAPLFPDGSAVYEVRPDHYMVMGDNTMNSLDSRSWGDFPAGNVIGKSFFVYWPITDRFGWGYHR